MKYFYGLEFIGFLVTFLIICVLKSLEIIGISWFLILGTIFAIPIIIMLIFLIEAIYFIIKNRKSIFNCNDDEF